MNGLALFYDVHTSGLPLWKEPSEDARQPHIVQLAAILVDLSTRGRVASLDVIIRPDGWTSDAEAFGVHGINAEYAAVVGVAEADAIRLFTGLWYNATVRVAHNEPFDSRILRIALMRAAVAGMVRSSTPDDWKAGQAECTQRLATPICQLPPTEKMARAGRSAHKGATLAEAYRHFFSGAELESTSAMTNAEACESIYFAVKGDFQ